MLFSAGRFLPLGDLGVLLLGYGLPASIWLAAWRASDRPPSRTRALSALAPAPASSMGLGSRRMWTLGRWITWGAFLYVMALATLIAGFGAR